MTRSRRAGVAATALLGLVVVEALAAYVLGPLSGLTARELNDLLVLSNATLGLALALAGWPIAAYRPGNRIGWLLLGGGVTYASTGGGLALLHAVANAGGADHPAWRAVATVVSGGWAGAIAFFIPMALLFFPDGHLPSRRWRWLVGVMAVNGPLFFALGVTSGFSGEVGVLGYLTLTEERVAPIGLASAVGLLVSYVGVLVAIVVRFRRGSEAVRRQLLWVMLALLVVVVVFALDPLLPDSVLSIYPMPSCRWPSCSPSSGTSCSTSGWCSRARCCTWC
ncbi:hypothetical protein [Phytohabitans rumicis]|uniref:Uncharacterized protein n=1 Tax=Phytohabitans rumicis TaxID=1076125 RepID=A0A6V8LP29_9ACTN|nr:hypothetical protein [Phytohabitans rumicis]GFJ95966.1 hypothetical protein Prum_096080 [Phytohabitans rumicis]